MCCSVVSTMLEVRACHRSAPMDNSMRQLDGVLEGRKHNVPRPHQRHSRRSTRTPKRKPTRKHNCLIQNKESPWEDLFQWRIYHLPLQVPSRTVWTSRQQCILNPRLLLLPLCSYAHTLYPRSRFVWSSRSIHEIFQRTTHKKLKCPPEVVYNE